MPRHTDNIRKRQRASGTKYEARWREPDGTMRGKTFATHAEAKAHLLTVAHSKRQGTYVPKVQGETLFRQVADEWLKATPRKPRTLALYRSILGSWLAPWQDRAVASIQYADVVDLVAAMRQAKRKPQTIRNVFNLAHGILNEAVDAGYIAVNPSQRARKSLDKSGKVSGERRRPLSAEQVQTLAGLLPPHYGLVVRLAAWSGLRAGEIAGLRVRRVNVLRSELHVEETVARLDGRLTADTPKSARSHRRVTIPASLARELGEYIAARGLGPDDYVFGDDDGKPWNHAAMYRRSFVPARDKIGRPDLRFHDLRHTHASLMAPHITMVELSRRLGHESYAFTADTYTHLYETDDPDKAAVLDALYRAH
jgi:integrase